MGLALAEITLDTLVDPNYRGAIPGLFFVPGALNKTSYHRLGFNTLSTMLPGFAWVAPKLSINARLALSSCSLEIETQIAQGASEC